MNKLNIEDLKNIKENNRSMLNLRKGYYKAKVIIHMGTCGIAAGARNVMSALMDEVTNVGAYDIAVKTGGCGGLCTHEPMAVVELENQPPVIYGDLDEKKIKEIFREHIENGNPVKAYAMARGSESPFS